MISLNKYFPDQSVFMNLQFIPHLIIILIQAVVLDIDVGNCDLSIPSFTDTGLPFDKFKMIQALPLGFILHISPDVRIFLNGISPGSKGPIA